MKTKEVDVGSTSPKTGDDLLLSPRPMHFRMQNEDEAVKLLTKVFPGRAR